MNNSTVFNNVKGVYARKREDLIPYLMDQVLRFRTQLEGMLVDDGSPGHLGHYPEVTAWTSNGVTSHASDEEKRLRVKGE